MNPIRLQSPSDVLAVLPYQLGYHPHDAVVVVTVRGRAVGLVERIDLPPPEHVAEAADALVAPLLSDLPDAAILVGYESSAGASRPLLDQLRSGCRLAGIDVLDRVVVRDGRWYSPDCEQGCCPADGLPLDADGAGPGVAELVAMGVSPLASRAAVADVVAADPSVAPSVAAALARRRSGGPRAVATPGNRSEGPRSVRSARSGAAAPDTATPDTANQDTANQDTPNQDTPNQDTPNQDMAGPDTAGPDTAGPDTAGPDTAGPATASPDGARRSWLVQWAGVADVSDDALQVDATPPGVVAELVLSLEDVELRDGLIARWCPDTLPLEALGAPLAHQLRTLLPAPAWAAEQERGAAAGRRVLARLQWLARAVPDEDAASVLTVLASVAWWLGDGAVAREALDRALAARPDYRLARLLERMVDLGVRSRPAAPPAPGLATPA